MGLNKKTILQIARECGATNSFLSGRPAHISNVTLEYTIEELERFVHRIEKETLLKAAELYRGRLDWLCEDLRRMAEQVGKE